MLHYIDKTRKNINRVVVSHSEHWGSFLLVDGSQVGSVVGVGEVCNSSFSFQHLVGLQGVTLDRVKMNIFFL